MIEFRQIPEDVFRTGDVRKHGVEKISIQSLPALNFEGPLLLNKKQATGMRGGDIDR